MKSLIDLYKKTKNLHHAYAIEGDKQAILEELNDFFEKDLKISIHGNPDFYFNEFKSFGIDSGRQIQSMASKKAVSGNTRIFVIAFSSITTEAQNSLLKLFEEPAEGVHFFVIVSSAEIFLPTLRSRFNILHQGLPLIEKNILVNRFLKISKTDRIKFFEDIIEEYKETKNKERALDFLNNIEASLYKSKDRPWTDRDIEVFEIIQKSRDYIHGRAPSVKMILENVAISIQ